MAVPGKVRVEEPNRERVIRPEKQQGWWSFAALLGVLLCTGAVYWQVGVHGFVDYDDPDYVTANQYVADGLTWANLAWAFTAGHASNWHPLTWLSHMVDVHCFGLDAGAHHLVNLLLHLVNTVLLFFALRKLTSSDWKPLMVAGLFALHPVHVESVAWISERKDLLSTCFFLLVLWVYAGYADAKAAGTRGWGRYVTALVLFAFGLMSKPMLVTVPCVLLLLDYWPLRRVAGGARRNWVRLGLEKIPFALLTLASCAITYAVQKKGGAVSSSLGLDARLENALVSYARYLGKTFWPDDLSVLYPHPGQWPAWTVGGAVILLVAITGFALWQARRHPYLLVGWLWFLGTLVPVIGLVQVGIQSMADRYTYIPLIGIFIAVVWGVVEICATWPKWRMTAVSTGTLALAGCAVLTWHQVQYWRNSETLFARAVKVTRNNYLAHNNLGYSLSNKGRREEALTHYQRSIEINPLYEDALNNMGYALAALKRHQEAIGFYERALRVQPDHVEVRNNLGNALSELGQIDLAMEHYEFVLGKQPDHADAHNNYGIALAMKGQLESAIGHFELAIRYKKRYAGAHSNLGNAYAVQGKMEEAIRQYEACLGINPADAQAHNNLGNVLAGKGRLEEAIGHYEEALRLNRDNPEAHFNLGMVFARRGETEKAVVQIREALRLRPGYPEAARQLERMTK